MKKPRSREHLPLLTWRPPPDPDAREQLRDASRWFGRLALRLWLWMLPLVGLVFYARQRWLTEVLPLHILMLLLGVIAVFPSMILWISIMLRFRDPPRFGRRYELYDNRIRISDERRVWLKNVKWWRIVEMDSGKPDEIEFQSSLRLTGIPLPRGRRRDRLLQYVKERVAEFDPNLHHVLNPHLGRLDIVLHVVVWLGGTIAMASVFGIWLRKLKVTGKGDFGELLLYACALTPGVIWYWLLRHKWNTAQRATAKARVLFGSLVSILTILLIASWPAITKLVRDLNGM